MLISHTSQTTEFAHSGKHRRLHLNVADSCFIGSAEVVLLVLLRVGAERTIQTGLTWLTDGIDSKDTRLQLNYRATELANEARLPPS